MPHIGEFVTRNPEDWIPATMQNAWVYFGAPYNQPAFYKDAFGIVHLRGLIKNGIVGNAAFVLPAGFRPEAQEIFGALNNGVMGTVEVLPAGNVQLSAGNNVYVSLDCITFKAYQ